MNSFLHAAESKASDLMQNGPDDLVYKQQVEYNINTLL